MNTKEFQIIENELSIALWEAPLKDYSTAQLWEKVQTGIYNRKQTRFSGTLKLKPVLLSIVLIALLVIAGLSLMAPSDVLARIANFFLPGVGLVNEESNNYILTEAVSIRIDDLDYVLSDFVSTETKTWSKIRIEGISRGAFEHLVQNNIPNLPYIVHTEGEKTSCDYWEAYYDHGMIFECQFPPINNLEEKIQLALPDWFSSSPTKEVIFQINLRVATTSDMVTKSHSPTRSNINQGISMAILQVNHTSESTNFVIHFDAPSLDEVILPDSLHNLKIEESDGFALNILEITTVFPNTGRTFLVKTVPVEPGGSLRFTLDNVSLMYSAPGETGSKLFSMTIPDEEALGERISLDRSFQISDAQLDFESAYLNKQVDSTYKLIFDVAVQENITDLMLGCDSIVCESSNRIGKRQVLPTILHPSINLDHLPVGELTIYLKSYTKKITGGWNITWISSEHFIQESADEDMTVSANDQNPETVPNQTTTSQPEENNSLAMIVNNLLQKGFLTTYSEPGWVHFSHEQIESEDNSYYQSGRVFGQRHSFTDWWVLLNENLEIEERVSISKAVDGSIIFEEVQIGTDVYNKTLNMRSEIPEFSLIPHVETLARDIESMSELDNAKIDSVMHNYRLTQQVTIEYGYSQPTNWGNVIKPIVKVTAVTLIDEQTGVIVQKKVFVTFEDGMTQLLFIDNYGIPTKVNELPVEAQSLLDWITERTD